MLQSNYYSVREIQLIASRGGGGGGGGAIPPEKLVTEVLAQVLDFSMVNFCLGIRLWEVTFVRQRFL